MAEPVDTSTKAKPHLKKKLPKAPASLPHEINSAGRTWAATRILINLPKFTASAPANLNKASISTEIPILGDTCAITTNSAPLPVPFSNDVSNNGSGFPALQTVSGSSLSAVEPKYFEMENMVLSSLSVCAAALEAKFHEGGVHDVMSMRLNVESSVTPSFSSVINPALLRWLQLGPSPH
ncbi:hypothetical protein DFH08DRAFT_813294 [Mycena albidolilacea]|uniref:Uncharacterized protein n=1 Tax=Mycena albidolilacea TaxID=1033008 RepID=A0AAD7ELH9_9AGAR|nr:hypothetical protein DFH08DRAFT_813294 [Mycena albidolilacea]